MKVRNLKEAIKYADDDAEVVMPDTLPVVSVMVLDGQVVLSDEMQASKPKTITSTVTTKFALYDLDPTQFIEWLTTEIEAGNELAGLTAKIVWNDVEFMTDK